MKLKDFLALLPGPAAIVGARVVRHGTSAHPESRPWVVTDSTPRTPGDDVELIDPPLLYRTGLERYCGWCTERLILGYTSREGLKPGHCPTHGPNAPVLHSENPRGFAPNERVVGPRLTDGAVRERPSFMGEPIHKSIIGVRYPVCHIKPGPGFKVSGQWAAVTCDECLKMAPPLPTGLARANQPPDEKPILLAVTKSGIGVALKESVDHDADGEFGEVLGRVSFELNAVVHARNGDGGFRCGSRTAGLVADPGEAVTCFGCAEAREKAKRRRPP